MSSRVRRFRRYECCFTGKDAVAWLTSNDKAATPEEAVMLGNDLLRAGLLHHVSFKRPFQDKDSLYRCCMLHTVLKFSLCQARSAQASHVHTLKEIRPSGSVLRHSSVSADSNASIR